MTVSDDGVGGADPSRGSGLRGLADRVEALNGSLGVDSPAGHGTRIEAEIPIPEWGRRPVSVGHHWPDEDGTRHGRPLPYLRAGSGAPLLFVGGLAPRPASTRRGPSG